MFYVIVVDYQFSQSCVSTGDPAANCFFVAKAFTCLIYKWCFFFWISMSISNIVDVIDSHISNVFTGSFCIGDLVKKSFCVYHTQLHVLYSACILLVNKTFDYLHMQCYWLWLKMIERNHCAYLLIGKWLFYSILLA